MADQLLCAEKRVPHMETAASAKDAKECKKLSIVLVQVVGDVLKQIAKHSGTTVINDYSGKNPDLKIEEITEEPKLFSENMGELFRSAAPVTEDLIIRNQICGLTGISKTRMAVSFLAR